MNLKDIFLFDIFTELAAASKSDSWVPINNVAPASDPELSVSDSALGTEKVDTEKETQEEKPEPTSQTNSPQKESQTQVYLLFSCCYNSLKQLCPLLNSTVNVTFCTVKKGLLNWGAGAYR